MAWSVDRIETGESEKFAVLVSDDGRTATIPLSHAETFAKCKISEGDVFELVLDGDRVSEMTALPLEREKRSRRNASRLLALFERKNKKRK